MTIGVGMIYRIFEFVVCVYVLGKREIEAMAHLKGYIVEEVLPSSYR